MISVKGSPLFNKRVLGEVLKEFQRQALQEVDSMHRDQFLSTTEDELVEHIHTKHQVNPLILHEENSVRTEPEEITIDEANFDRCIRVHGFKITISIPFDGAIGLWQSCPSEFKTLCPSGIIRSDGAENGILGIDLEASSGTPYEEIKKSIDKNIELIKCYIEYQKKDLEYFHKHLSFNIRKQVQSRRERLRLHDGIVERLNIPLKHRDNVPEIKPIGMKRKLVRPLPPIPKEGFKAEPGISDADYDHILKVIKHEGRTFETAPKTFHIHDEEGLRDILLAHLNGHYEGAATGETFRKKGKTDIRIEDRERSAFVGECKIWKGSKELLEAVDQLCGYTTWRDCKAALIIFNKHNKKFSELLSVIPENLKKHPRFKRDLPTSESGEWNFVFSSEEDENRLIYIRMFIFNLFAAAG